MHQRSHRLSFYAYLCFIITINTFVYIMTYRKFLFLLVFGLLSITMAAAQTTPEQVIIDGEAIPEINSVYTQANAVKCSIIATRCIWKDGTGTFQFKLMSDGCRLAWSQSNSGDADGTYCSFTDEDSNRYFTFLGKDGNAEWVVGLLNSTSPNIPYLLMKNSQGHRYLVLLSHKDFVMLTWAILDAAKINIIQLNEVDGQFSTIASILLPKGLLINQVTLR